MLSFIVVLVVCTLSRFYTSTVIIVEGEDKYGGVIMEFEMQWDGNPNSIVDVKTIKLHIEVGNFQIKN